MNHGEHGTTYASRGRRNGAAPRIAMHPASAHARTTSYTSRRSASATSASMDVPGRADALGLGWVYMKPKNGHPGIIQKTGGGGGFITYMAMNPQANVGAFVVVTRSPLTRFNNMSDGINDLVSELSGAQPNMQTASQ